MSQLSYSEALALKLKKNPFYTLEKAVYEILLQEISTLHIKPGTTLVEYQIAEEFNISRSPVREALKTLEKQGFVKKEHNRKIVVEAFDMKEYNELIQFRCTLEPAATGIASQLMTDDDLRCAKEYADLLMKACKEEDYSAIFEYEHLFHNFIVQCSHNRYIINSYDNIQHYITRSRAAYLYEYKDMQLTDCAEEHLLIYNCLLLRNRSLAESVVTQLLQLLYMPFENRFSVDEYSYTTLYGKQKTLLSDLVGMYRQIEERDNPESM